MKILNLNEGSFPIELNIDIDKVDIPSIGCLQKTLKFEVSITKISKNLLKCDGSIKGKFIDVCQTCLKETEVDISNKINVILKDSSEINLDSSSQDQTHYQDLEYFNIDNFVEEEIALIYPDIVKCTDKCIEANQITEEKKNLPFKKIRDLID